jgi:hypothetical protein
MPTLEVTDTSTVDFEQGTLNDVVSYTNRLQLPTLERDGLVSYWGFEDTNNYAKDSVGSNDAEFVSNPYSMYFDGTDRIELLDSDNINSASTYSAKTVSLWFKADGDVNTRQVIYHQGGSSNGLNIYLLDGKVYGGGWSEVTGWDGSWINNPVSANTWYKVTLGFNSANTSVSLAIDNRLIGQVTDTTATEMSGHDEGCLGAITATTQFHDNATVSGTYGFTGWIDEVIHLNNVEDIEFFYVYNVKKKYNITPRTEVAFYFEFNEGSGTTAIDSSPNGYDMTIYGATYSTDVPFDNVPQRTSGKFNSGLLFNGVDSYLPIQNLSYTGESSIMELTVLAWVKISSTGSEQILMSFDRSEYFRCSLSDDGSGLYPMFCTTTLTQNTHDLVGSINIQDDTWHHVAYTFSSSTGEKRIYIDGVLDVSYSVTSGDGIGISDDTRYGFIGSGSEAVVYNGATTPVGSIYGSVDEVALYHRELSQSEVQAMMSRRLVTTGNRISQSFDLSPLGVVISGNLSWHSKFRYISALSSSEANYPYKDTHGYNNTTGDSEVCSGLVTFDEALQHAYNQGGRLPTKAEVSNLATEGSGCGYDAEMIWTCDKGADSTEHWVVIGDNDYYEHAEEIRQNTSTAYVRFVADDDLNRTDAVNKIDDQAILDYFGISILVETSVDQQSTWQEVSNGGQISGIEYAETLSVRQTLTTNNTDYTPLIESSSVYVMGTIISAAFFGCDF